MTTRKTNMHFGIDPRTREIVIGSFRMKLPESRWLRTVIGVLLIVGGLLGFRCGSVLFGHALAFRLGE